MTTLNQSLGISGHERMKNKFKHMNMKLFYEHKTLITKFFSVLAFLFFIWGLAPALSILKFSSYLLQIYFSLFFLCTYFLSAVFSVCLVFDLFFFLISFTLHFYLNKYCMVWHLVRHMQKKKKGKKQFDLFKSHN